MTKTRLEAFSDGVLAIIITIMVLELKIPHSTEWHALLGIWPTFASYIMSFIFVGIYWGNHHHTIHTVKRISGKLIWANMHLLFWLSIIPFSTGWMGENHFAQNTVILYGINLLLCAVAYWIMQQVISSQHEHSTALIEALEKQKQKGYISLTCYLAAIPAAFIHPLISAGIFVFVAILWVIPDKNIEKVLKD
ncbi:MAG: TMEM175 family protein [Chitinophagales bacterium]